MIILFQAILQSKPGKIVLLEACLSDARTHARLVGARVGLSRSAESTAAVRRREGGPTAAGIKEGGAAGAAGKATTG